MFNRHSEYHERMFGGRLNSCDPAENTMSSSTHTGKATFGGSTFGGSTFGGKKGGATFGGSTFGGAPTSYIGNNKTPSMHKTGGDAAPSLPMTPLTPAHKRADMMKPVTRNLYNAVAMERILHHGSGGANPIMHKLLHDLHHSAKKKGFHVTHGGARFHGGNPLVAATAVQAVPGAVNAIMNPISEAIRSKSNWDYRGRELEVNKKSRNDMIRLMMQEDDPDRRLEYARLIYQM